MNMLGNLVKQAGEMQARMQEAKERLADAEISGSSGGGMVTVVLNGLGEARKVAIDPSLIADGDAAVVEDLVLAAFNDAKSRSAARMKEEMSKVTGGIELPGMPLPF